MLSNELKSNIEKGLLNPIFTTLYGKENVEFQKTRYTNAIKSFEELYGENVGINIYSAPGRTEICGNHTDHNFGRVLAAAVDLDVIGIVSKNENNVINVKSEGHKADYVNLEDLTVTDEEKNTSQSLIRGTCARFIELGYKIGGFNGYTTSNVLKGSGLSSSAAFEVLIGTILSNEFNSGDCSAVEIAKIAQYTENVYFGKPCGLMDQTASSVGGFITIDFKDPKNPIIEKINFDFDSTGHVMCIIDTGGNHADLTDDYSSIPIEMKQVAKLLGCEVLRETSTEKLIEELPNIRGKVSDRAVLRAFHFLDENQRVKSQSIALKDNDFNKFLKQTIESGISSFVYSQNVYSSHNVTEQGLSLALALSQRLLNGRGAYRVHGGGFAGTIQAFVPLDMLNNFKDTIESVFGEKSCYILKIRPLGGIKIV